MKYTLPRPKYGPLSFNVDDETGFLRVRDTFEFERVEGHTEVIEEGFQTDLASTPPVIRRWFPPWGRYTKATVVHDHDYKYGGMWKISADIWFFLGMLALGVPVWKATLFLVALLCFGWVAWYKHRSKDS